MAHERFNRASCQSSDKSAELVTQVIHILGIAVAQTALAAAMTVVSGITLYEERTNCPPLWRVAVVRSMDWSYRDDGCWLTDGETVRVVWSEGDVDEYPAEVFLWRGALVN